MVWSIQCHVVGRSKNRCQPARPCLLSVDSALIARKKCLHASACIVHYFANGRIVSFDKRCELLYCLGFSSQTLDIKVFLSACTSTMHTMSLICQPMPEKSGVSKLSPTVGHPVQLQCLMYHAFQRASMSPVVACVKTDSTNSLPRLNACTHKS